MSNPCPAKYYCPSPTDVKPCPSGYFCREGSATPTSCAWGLIVCPELMMDTPIKTLSCVMFGLTLVFLLAIFKFLIQSMTLKPSANKHDVQETLNQLESEQERALLLKYEELHRALSTKFSSQQSFKGQSVEHTGDAVFNAIDEDNSGFVCTAELIEYLRHDGIDAGLLHEVFDSADKDNSGTLCRNEFNDLWQTLVAAQRKVSNQKSASKSLVYSSEVLGYVTGKTSDSVFDVADRDSFGTITVTKLMDFLRQDGLTTDMADEIIKATKKDLSAAISRDELKALWCEIASSAPKKKSTSAPPVDAKVTFQDVSHQINVSFSKLSLNLPNGSKILKNISGELKASRVTALMGPSGAGKTSLLNLLRGQAQYAKVSGNICVNGVPVQSLALFNNRMGFVPQEEIMFDALTVRENIIYHGLIFNKRGYKTLAECVPLAAYVEELLGIDFISNSVVGSVAKRGISGGQKKRVSVGMEIMKEPAMFLLDEPTSGLDSATSLSLMHSLGELSQKGVNVISTIHQPRQEILEKLDQVLLLAPGGVIAYFGPAMTMAAYFSRMRYTCPTNCNISDFVMDVLSGLVKPDNTSKVPHVKEMIKFVSEHWEQNGAVSVPTPIVLTKTEDAHLSPVNNFRSVIEKAWITYKCVLFRELKIYFRTFDFIIRTACTLFFIGLMIGWLFGSVALKVQGGLGQALFSGQLAFASLTHTTALKLFAHGTVMRTRLESAGIMLFPLYMGKICAGITEVIIFPFAFLAGFYPFICASAPFVDYLRNFILLHCAMMGLANFIAIVFTGPISHVVASGSTLILWSFGGFNPTYKILVNTMGPLIALNFVSPFKQTFQLLTVTELKTYSKAWAGSIDLTLNMYGWDLANESYCMSMLAVYAVVANLLAYVVMEVRRDNFQLFVSIKQLWDDKLQQLPWGTKSAKVATINVANPVDAV